jgi:hypothetical protein
VTRKVVGVFRQSGFRAPLQLEQVELLAVMAHQELLT